jgi:hypothetical protein
MAEQARPEQLSGQHALVYEGYTTKLFQALSLPTPYYSSILQRLQQMGCIRKLSRGGGSAFSRWQLVDDPTLEAFIKAGPRQKQTRLALVEQRLATLETKVTQLEQEDVG